MFQWLDIQLHGVVESKWFSLNWTSTYSGSSSMGFDLYCGTVYESFETLVVCIFNSKSFLPLQFQTNLDRSEFRTSFTLSLIPFVSITNSMHQRGNYHPLQARISTGIKKIKPAFGTLHGTVALFLEFALEAYCSYLRLSNFFSTTRQELASNVRQVILYIYARINRCQKQDRTMESIQVQN